jgi:transposase InsO family protein
MKEMYSIAGITKQALWGHNRRQQEQMGENGQVIGIMKSIRKNHKRMGCRRMYYSTTNTSSVGRDRFEQIGLMNGFRLQRKRNVAITTWSQRVEVYPNLIEGRVINRINQVWQSDIFYVKVEGKDHYGVTIIDVYSRRLLALNPSDSLSSDQLVKALKMAIRVRKGSDLSGCIFHSDRGSQYVAKNVKALLMEYHMQGSMCSLPQENAYAERVQGTIKHEYLYEMDLILEGLQSQSRKIVSLYNNHRPHTSLGMMTPTSFERYVQNLDDNQRPELTIYQWDYEFSTQSAVINKKKKEAKKKNLLRLNINRKKST